MPRPRVVKVKGYSGISRDNFLLLPFDREEGGSRQRGQQTYQKLQAKTQHFFFLSLFSRVFRQENDGVENTLSFDFFLFGIIKSIYLLIEKKY